MNFKTLEFRVFNMDSPVALILLSLLVPDQAEAEEGLLSSPAADKNLF